MIPLFRLLRAVEDFPLETLLKNVLAAVLTRNGEAVVSSVSERERERGEKTKQQ